MHHCTGVNVNSDKLYTAGIVDTGGKFTAGVNDAGGHIIREVYIDLGDVGGRFDASLIKRQQRDIIIYTKSRPYELKNKSQPSYNFTPCGFILPRKESIRNTNRNVGIRLSTQKYCKVWKGGVRAEDW